MIEKEILSTLERSILSMAHDTPMGRFHAASFLLPATDEPELEQVRNWFSQRRKASPHIYGRVGRIEVGPESVTIQPLVSTRLAHSVVVLPFAGDPCSCIETMTEHLDAKLQASGANNKEVLFFEFAGVATQQDVDGIRYSLLTPLLDRESAWYAVRDVLVDHFGVVVWLDRHPNTRSSPTEASRDPKYFAHGMRPIDVNDTPQGNLMQNRPSKLSKIISEINDFLAEKYHQRSKTDLQ
jgi:hypothetical protein